MRKGIGFISGPTPEHTLKTFKALKNVAVGLAAGAALLACAGFAQAATQGPVGTTSSGSVTISASISAHVDITSLSDVTFADADLAPVVNTSNQATKTANVCIWSNNADRSYYVTASGSGAANAFSMANGANPAVPYEVYWNASSGQTTGAQLTAGAKSAKLTSTGSTPTCGGGVSATLVVGIMGSDANTMVASATYTGALTLLVAPN
jgi:hypothetical protein